MTEEIKRLWDAWEEADRKYFEDEDNEEAQETMEDAENELANAIRLYFNKDQRGMISMLHAKKREVLQRLESLTE